MLPTDLLGLLRLCLLVLLYLFFLRVLRAVWVEVKGPGAVAAEPVAASGTRGTRRPPRAKRPGKAAAAGATLHIVAPAERAGSTFGLDGELTVGRAPGCQVNLGDDTFVSQLHARVFERDGQLFVEDLGSTNGTYLNNRKVESPVAMHRGDQLQVGKTVMEVR